MFKYRLPPKQFRSSRSMPASMRNWDFELVSFLLDFQSISLLYFYAGTSLLFVSFAWKCSRLDQVANAKLLDALRSRMLDVGASRSANRLPSLQHANGDGSSAASAAILQSISSQLEVSCRMLQIFFSAHFHFNAHCFKFLSSKRV